MKEHLALRAVTLCLIYLHLIRCALAADAASALTLAKAGQSTATIVIAEAPTIAARLAAKELQHHIRLVSGASLPIVSAVEGTSGVRILVGESAATHAMGLQGDDFEPQEYLIAFRPDTLVLIGRDWIDTPENRARAGRGTSYSTLQDFRVSIDYRLATGKAPNRDSEKDEIELPGLFDDQGTCYAVYDFLERFCGVRWYGPTPLNIVHPTRPTLSVAGTDIRRAPALKYREGIGGGWPIVNAQWNKPSPDQLNLYWRRLRVGGERWAGNHSMRSFQDRFLKPNPGHPDLFEERREEFFAHGRSGGGGQRQFCYTNAGLVAQTVQDAQDYFDDKGLKGLQTAMGDSFAIVPNDNASWCLCDDCQARLAIDEDNRRAGHFNSGTASHYLFGFVDGVAREVAKTHPNKYITTLAYHVYAFRPTQFELPSAVSVAPCLQPRNYWAPLIERHEMEFYKKWVGPRDRPIYLWNYYCFPMEPAVIQGWHCFPGFSARRLGSLIKMYHADGVRGVFLCGIGEQVDYYLTMKMYDDPTINPETLLDEFFTSYFGAAADPMRRFHDRIEEIYCDPHSYPEQVRGQERQFHQTEEFAWRYLGTEERMNELQKLIEQAVVSASGELEASRVATWKKGVWDYMTEGRRMYLEKTRQ